MYFLFHAWVFHDNEIQDSKIVWFEYLKNEKKVLKWNKKHFLGFKSALSLN